MKHDQATPETMNAAVLYAADDLRFEGVATPVPKANEVLIKISKNGLCGSDIHFYEDGKLGPYVVTEPYIPGHEASGVVVRSADDGSGPAVGTRVAIEPGIPCRACDLCKTGRYNLCEDVTFLSAPPVNGTFAEYVALAADFAHPLPDGVNDEEGAFIEPLAVAVQACQRAGVGAGSTAAVFGAGPIGLVHLLVLKAFGAASVVSVDPLANRREAASEIGADMTFDPSDDHFLSHLRDFTRGIGADFVFDASGSSQAAAASVHAARRGGVVTLVGWPERAEFPFPIEEVIEKELDIRGVNRYCNAYPVAIALMNAGKIDISPLISHRFPFADVLAAFASASGNKRDTVKVMVG